MDQKKRKKRMQAFFLVAIVLVFWNVMQQAETRKMIKIACVGDSITFGAGVEKREENCYPVQLQNMLGTKEYRIGNFGVNGVTVQKNGDKPYQKEERFEQSAAYEADKVVLLLGTNDSKAANWKDEETFQKDYLEMIDAYKNLDTKPEVILVTPPKAYPPDPQWEKEVSVQQKMIEAERKLILEIGEKKELKVLDFYEQTEKHPEWFTADGVHLNKEGAKALAQGAAEILKN